MIEIIEMAQRDNKWESKGSPEFCPQIAYYEGSSLKIAFIKAKTSPNGSASDELEMIIADCIRNLDCDILVAPEYSFFQLDSEPLLRSEMDRILAKFRALSQGKDMLIIPGTFVRQEENHLYNTACVISDGDILIEYDKVRDGGESWIAKNFSLKSCFGKSLGIFKWGNLIAGIEICADRNILYESEVRNLDLQFLISCGPWESMSCLKSNGVFIMNDGGHPYCVVQKHQEEERVFDKEIYNLWHYNG